ncbi:cytidine and dCMP deaminase domain-containing protein 1 isoform X2 [Chiloscyllium plagiosum]|uniref:cytidine and dCMP deaminase domain-containing protein 1 isoform X2 n=1 Tax=Chiloscyllium plagiosum TaxID=36176 RepID=UPI001CB84D68|nr:cytidine and dCMP deaminase domain-containing protein 1 isoform X2 [Chiloscyllium plagiosum]
MSHLQEPACQSQVGRQERCAQTECNARGLSPRLSKVNFFTLLSLWMELFPNNEQKAIQRRKNGLVVVYNSKIIGLHCSSAELHAGQIAVVKHGSKMKDCDLYFSRKPCSTCLKMVLNAGVNRISYWPGDPEISLVDDYVMNNCNSDAKLDAKAVERLKSNSRSRICTLLQPLAYDMLQFVEETSKKSTVDCSVPEYGTFRFYCDDSDKACDEHTNDEFQKFARHCMVQARLLAYRTEDQKIGVGAVIWAEGKSNNCDGTGARYLIGCGYNAYPMGSEYADYPQLDEKQQKDREARKFRYIVHAEQNALTFRCQDIKDEEKTMIFVTKCPCDECVPLINNAGIKQIYTGDLDAGKVKADISYQKFSGLQGVRKFTWQEAPTNSIITSSVHTTHRKRGPNKSFILQSGCTTISASTLESSVLENPQSPLGKGDLKRPLTTPWSESQKEELLNLEINEPAFKRRVVEQQSYLQSLLTSVQVMNDAVDRMMLTMSRLNSSLADVQNLLKQKLTAFQTTREEASPQIVSVVENSFIQGLSNIGTSLQNSLNAGISDVGSKVQESLQMGFESLGEKIQSTMREGYANMINEQICAHQNLSDKYERALPTRGLHNSSQEVGNHDVSQLHHPSQLSSGSSLESRIPTTEVQIPGGMKI